LGASGRILEITGTSADAPTTQSGTTGGGIIVARYEVPLGPLALSFGPELEPLARPVSIEVGAAEVLRIPTFVVGVSLDAITQ
jgi:hypothetical protein